MSEVIKVSAPGKVILFGEHSVVYGKTAVAVSVNLRMKVKLEENDDKNVHLLMADIKVNSNWCVDSLQKLKTWAIDDGYDSNSPSVAKECLAAVNDFLGVDPSSPPTSDKLAQVIFLSLYFSISCVKDTFPGFKLTVDSELPIGGGLGSSAAYSTCLVTALLSQRGVLPLSKGASIKNVLKWSPEELDLINKWAFLAETIAHGSPSGIDNSVCTYGGIVKFRGGKLIPLEGNPSLKILLVNTNVSRNTKVLVHSVRSKFNKFPQIINPVLEAMDAVAESAVSLLSELSAAGGDSLADKYKSLEELIAINQPLLVSLGVSHPKLNEICQIASQNSLQAKLTGAGGGGFAYVLIPPYADSNAVSQLTQRLEADGFLCWETTIGGQGLKIE